MKRNVCDILLFILLIITCVYCASPLYYFEPQVPFEFYDKSVLELNEMDIVSKISQTSLTLTFETNEDYSSFFSGVEIYYKTGALYALYTQQLNDITQSFLLAIDTISNVILFRDFQLCGGIGLGIALDQTTGDLHFINSSSTLITWGKWNVETNLTSILQTYENQQETFISAMVYNSITETLWVEYGSDFVAYQIGQSAKIFPSNNLWSYFSINAKTGVMYAAFERQLFQLKFTSTSLETTLVCYLPDYEVEGYTSQYAGDVDYVSNTLVGGINNLEITGGNYNLYMFVDLNNCDISYYNEQLNADNDNLLGAARFNCGVY